MIHVTDAYVVKHILCHQYSILLQMLQLDFGQLIQFSQLSVYQGNIFSRIALFSIFL